MDEQHRRFPRVDRRDCRRAVRDIFGIERVAPQVHPGEIDAHLEKIGIPRQCLRGENAAVREAPDADPVRVDIRPRLEILAARQDVVAGRTIVAALRLWSGGSRAARINGRPEESLPSVFSVGPGPRLT